MKGNSNILVVDSDRAIVKNAWKVLNRAGYAVEGIHGEEEARSKIEANKYTLVFVALSRQQVGGISLIRWIKRFHPATGVVVLTDDFHQEILREAHSLGIISHVRKPYTAKVLKDVTKKALEWVRENGNRNDAGEEFPQSKVAKLEKVIHQYRNDSNQIIQVLLQTQDIFGYLPDVMLERIARAINVYPSELRSIVSFYPCFRTRPDGIHPPCYVKGRERIWGDVTWKTGKRVTDAVNEFIRTRQLEEAKGGA